MFKVKILIVNYHEILFENVQSVKVETDYAIADKILYVFSEGKKTKIPFKDIIGFEIE